MRSGCVSSELLVSVLFIAAVHANTENSTYTCLCSYVPFLVYAVVYVAIYIQ